MSSGAWQSAHRSSRKVARPDLLPRSLSGAAQCAWPAGPRGRGNTDDELADPRWEPAQGVTGGNRDPIGRFLPPRTRVPFLLLRTDVGTGRENSPIEVPEICSQPFEGRGTGPFVSRLPAGRAKRYSVGEAHPRRPPSRSHTFNVVSQPRGGRLPASSRFKGSRLPRSMIRDARWPGSSRGRLPLGRLRIRSKNAPTERDTVPLCGLRARRDAARGFQSVGVARISPGSGPRYRRDSNFPGTADRDGGVTPHLTRFQGLGTDGPHATPPQPRPSHRLS